MVNEEILPIKLKIWETCLSEWTSREGSYAIYKNGIMYHVVVKKENKKKEHLCEVPTFIFKKIQRLSTRLAQMAGWVFLLGLLITK